ncbi:hypothetical protein ACFUAG_17990, partial [Streptomyces sp. NPDC057193]
AQMLPGLVLTARGARSGLPRVTPLACMPERDAGEHDARLFFERAASDELLFGPVRRLRARAAERTGRFGEVAA